MKISDLDVVFISYDEPNAEEHWADLLNKCPWAKRVHGVKGFDAAHKVAATESKTEWLVTVDGDNVVDEEFFSGVVPTEPKVMSWAGRNVINGLVYGNGGLKIWPRALALSMKTHEAAADSRNAVEFCWGIPYRHMRGSFSETRPNETPRQAFRAGYREGFKMCMHEGIVVGPSEFQKTVPSINRRRLQVWCSVGSDAANGDWAIMGARLGAIAALEGEDPTVIRDLEKIDAIQAAQAKYDFNCWEAGTRLDLRELVGIDVTWLNPEQSRFFKSVYVPPSRSFVEPE